MQRSKKNAARKPNLQGTITFMQPQQQDFALQSKYKLNILSQYLTKPIKIHSLNHDVPLSIKSQIIRRSLRQEAQIMMRRTKNNNLLRMRQIDLNQTLTQKVFPTFIEKKTPIREYRIKKVIVNNSCVSRAIQLSNNMEYSTSILVKNIKRKQKIRQKGIVRKVII